MTETLKSTFRIIEEAPLRINKNKESEIFIMLICIDKGYALEVNTRTEFIGRVTVSDRKSAEQYFSEIKESVNTFSDFEEAVLMLQAAYLMNSLEEFRFIINNLSQTHLDREFDFLTIVNMPSKYSCKTFPLNTDLIFEYKHYELKVEIYFPDKSKVTPIGYFKAPDADSKFRFYFNAEYLLI